MSPSSLSELKIRLVGTEGQPRVGLLARPARAVARPAMRVLFNSRVTGLENVPVEGPAIISANHRSFFDTPLLMATSPRPVTFLGKAEYMDKRTTRYLFPAFGMVPINRDAARASMAALTTAAALLDDGQLVGIYPEGTRSRDGDLHRGHTGVAHLALMTGAPIVPVGLIGTHEIQPIGRAVPRPFSGAVRVRFGEPIHADDYRAGGSRTRRRHMVNDVMAAIAAMTDQERSDDFASEEPPLIRGGSESVYQVTAHRAAGLNWTHAAERAIDDVCNRYDDARVGEIRDMACIVDDAGEVRFEIELALSTKFRHPTQPITTTGRSS